MKNTLFLFAILLGLAACTPAVVTPTSTVMRLPTATETPVPSPTVTLTQTNTQLPTETPSPLETPTPEFQPVSSTFMESFKWNTGFRQVTQQELNDQVQFIIANGRLPLSNPAVKLFNKTETPDGDVISIDFKFGINCLPWDFISLDLPSGNIAHLVIVEAIVMGQDGNKHTDALVISEDPLRPGLENDVVQAIHSIPYSRTIYAIITTKIKNPAIFHNPVYRDVVAASGSVGIDLQNGKFDIPAVGEDAKPLCGGLSPQ